MKRTAFIAAAAAVAAFAATGAEGFLRVKGHDIVDEKG